MPAARTTDSSPNSGEDILTGRVQSKKKRIPGSCDICRRKKIKCDSGETPDNRCTYCVQHGHECTHKEVTRALGSARGYVENLEARLEKMDKLLANILPGIDVSTLEVTEDKTAPLPRNDDDELNALATRMLKLQLNPPKNRFMGKSSALQLVQTALDSRDDYISGKSKAPGGEEWKELGRIPWGAKRKEFWETPEWAETNRDDSTIPSYTYPPSDLLMSLVELYFTHVNPFYPLLHRPTFIGAVEEKQHFMDQSFGGIVLLVCALGAKYSDDPRVFTEGSGTARSAGCKWFKQVDALKISLNEKTSLHELQTLALSSLFEQTTEAPLGVWTQLGVGLRRAQEVGAHRRRRKPNVKANAEDELWKRAFWVIMSLDRLESTSSGRPCGLQEEDFDLDLPIDCDDEYWDHDFQQPSGKPTTMSYFNCYLGLMDILAYASRVIYPIRRPKNLFGRVFHFTDQQIVAELNSALNGWMDSVPEHLRWNPNCTNELWLKQSSSLYSMYYNIQIFIHRPFIPSSRNPQPVTFPSLAICTNAARSCCRVLESFSRLSALPFPNLQATALQAALVLLLNLWSGKKSGVNLNPQREMENVQKCMEMLRASEQRWSAAGRYWDILAELAFAGALAIPAGTTPCNPFAPVRTTKPSPPSDEADSASPATSASSSTPPSDSTPNSSETSISQVGSSAGLSFNIPPGETMNFSLPTYGNELGRLPIYGQFSFLDSMSTPMPGIPSGNGHSTSAMTTTSAALPYTSTEMSSFSIFPTQSTQPTQSTPGMDVAPRNLFTVADSFVKDALFNGQMSSDMSMFRSTQPAQHFPLDMSSIFATDPGDFGDLTRFYATNGMTTDHAAPDEVRENTNGSSMATGNVGPGDGWPPGTNVAPSYTTLADFDGFLGLQQHQTGSGASGFYNNRRQEGDYEP